MAFEKYWNDVYKRISGGKPTYDNWLDKYLGLIKKTKGVVLDLGCGLGNDSLFLTERGFDVLSVDYSTQAIKNVKRIIPKAKTKIVDISKKLPFKDEEFEVVIADLSLHYFDDKTTTEIMKEIKRILKVGGYLFARVNSVDDVNYGAGQGEKLEDNYYFVDGYNKRFFSFDDINKYFSVIGEVEACEADMLRYEKAKKVIEVKVTK